MIDDNFSLFVFPPHSLFFSVPHNKAFHLLFLSPFFYTFVFISNISSDSPSISPITNVFYLPIIIYFFIWFFFSILHLLHLIPSSTALSTYFILPLPKNWKEREEKTLEPCYYLYIVCSLPPVKYLSPVLVSTCISYCTEIIRLP